jgi:molecular chaperone GrpE
MNQKPEHSTETKVEKALDTKVAETPGEESEVLNSIPTGETNAQEVALSSEVEQLRADLEAARQETAENLDKFLRAKAESENIRRRAENDVTNAHKYALERFVGEILAVKDSLELARTVDIKEENHKALEKMHEGLDLTLKLMDGIFQKFGLTTMDPAGEKFDPEKHQAISMVESGEIAPNHVINVVQKGYQLHDRVLRPAMVVVARAKSTTDGENKQENG